MLDIGCNAGRHALYLQQNGLEVVGVDVSPLAIAVANARGLKRAEVLSIDDLPADLGTFDTVLMLGNNFGLFANAAKARRLLRRFRAFTRMSGQIRLRARYTRFVTPWFDYLMVSSAEMAELIDGTGWRVAEEHRNAGARFYTAIIERIA